MVALLLALALQAPADKHLESFLKGDETARAELLKLGIRAIRPLQKIREKSAEKVDLLIREIKKSAMEPSESPLARKLEAKVTIRAGGVRINDDPERRRMDWDDVRAALPCPVIVMPFDPKEAKAMAATITLADRPAREALDQLFLQTGLDHGSFHNPIVLAPPDRLWPTDPAKPASFHAAAAAVQDLDPGDAAVRKALQSRSITLKLVDASLETIFEMALKTEFEYAIATPAKSIVIPIIDADEMSTFDALCLATQAAGYDFTIAEGKVVVARPKGK